MTPIEPEICATCSKQIELCVCSSLEPIDTDLHILILRHPQEQDRALGTAYIASRQFKNATLKTGLSWSSLTKIMGRPVDPKRWGVLYLGTAKAAVPLPKQTLTVVNRQGAPVKDQETVLENLEGIILLDGNWAQAKALWWRNAWLLKCPRLILQPPRVSLYGNLRKEPRRESVSTLEAAAYTVAELQNAPELIDQILAPFALLLQKAHQHPSIATPKTGPRPDRRRRKKSNPVKTTAK